MDRHSQATPRKMHSRFISLRWILFFLTAVVFVLTAQAASAQRSPGFGGASGATLTVNVVAPDGNTIDMPAIVILSSISASSSPQEQASDDGVAQFQNLKEGAYFVFVSLPGFKSAKQEVQIVMMGLSEASVVMESDDGSDQPAAPGMMLAPKAKKDINDGIAALHASKYDEARKHFEAAYKLAPGDPDVNDALGLLYIVKKDTPHAQEYISRALSLDPNNLNALVDDGQLKLIQEDFNGAQPPLEKAVNLAPHDYFAHWLLGIGYYGSRQYEKARVEAVAAIKASKGAASDAEFLLGQALAGLGRNAEALATLQKFVNEKPTDYYAPSAKTLIAKLQTAPAATPGQLPAVEGPSAQNNAAIPTAER